MQTSKIRSELQVVSSNSHQTMSSKSDIKKGMSTEQIADIISDYLISHDRHFDILKQTNFPVINVVDAFTFQNILKNHKE